MYYTPTLFVCSSKKSIHNEYFQKICNYKLIIIYKHLLILNSNIYAFVFHRFGSLQSPARKRREALEESLRFHKFGFELEAELGWIREHLPLASSETLGQNLHQAQSLHKKHKKLEAEIIGHQPMIDKTLASGEALVHQSHPETKQVINTYFIFQCLWLLTLSLVYNR